MKQFKFISSNILLGTIIAIIPFVLFYHPGIKPEGFHFERSTALKSKTTDSNNKFKNAANLVKKEVSKIILE
ncbi:hypothetical protein WOSG25_040040 [Weissella oryzae SG25]|uniref:Uncharacterized protein n=1 Tax=Weissella oryzae (strain DSM 25784 / JCM 18191 / LMG 30913 / SG25) TaxID=1329250 RepID=A0A069CSV8_WEIOS|nr:hypothetical protein [Weissella oryzae]GAK30564.1 hypothetical protein WOSG25_040040 [Weissella oryzae SG25]